MRFITEESRLPLLPCVATIGCFDGVHRGHRYLIEQVRREARARGLHSTLITFPVHPRQVMQSDYRPQWLTCLPQKKDLLQQEDADYCILLPFTHQPVPAFPPCRVRAIPPPGAEVRGHRSPDFPIAAGQGSNRPATERIAETQYGKKSSLEKTEFLKIFISLLP